MGVFDCVSRNFGGALYPVADMANHKFRATQDEGALGYSADPACLEHMHRRENQEMQACAKRTLGTGRGFLATRGNYKSRNLPLSLTESAVACDQQPLSCRQFCLGLSFADRLRA